MNDIGWHWTTKEIQDASFNDDKCTAWESYTAKIHRPQDYLPFNDIPFLFFLALGMNEIHMNIGNTKKTLAKILKKKNILKWKSSNK